MSQRIRIAAMRDENYDSGDLAHAHVRFWNAKLGKHRYKHSDDCPLCALLNAVQSAHSVAQERTGHELGGEHPLYVKLCTLDETLARFDFGDDAVREGV